MTNFDQIKNERKDDKILFVERERFVKENYPQKKSNYKMDELINSGLEGMDVIEKRNKDNEIEGMISYVINKDEKGMQYLSIGIMLTKKESQGGGVMKNLILELKNIATKNNCEYITAIADTEEGEEFLLKEGFSEELDEVNGRDYLRLEL
ncbi:MAG: hypothetical protein PHT16_02210 [Candidatus Pacebacteria bacterium]|nr:hypothetical protein [Candidatus Paceibacterota bacterium]